MADDELTNLREGAKESLQRMQEFDPQTLPQVERLGAEVNFQPAVEPAKRLIALYKQLPLDVLDILPQKPLTEIQERANADYEQLDAILKFDTEAGSNTSRRDSAVQSLENAHASAFMKLHPWISYSVRRTADLTVLEDKARATIQSLKDDAEAVRNEMAGIKEETDQVLEEVRRAAAEQGVSQEAEHFKRAAEGHEEDASTWLKRTVWLAIALGAYSILSLFLHRIPWLTPTVVYETIQLTVSKVLIFAVLSFMLYLCARHFLASRHNAIVNRHRQDALTTYRTLVEAAGEKANRDIVLTHAADCIYSPQPTGFSSGQSSDGRVPTNLVNLISDGMSRGS